jgi:hydroxyacylglutathione hydrolase
MIFRQILYRDLGCASYFLADGGHAVVVDPRWDIEVYLELAAEEGVRIAHVLDTHLHADHVSGRERLAERTGARAHTPDDLASADDPLQVGSLRLQAWATPGHRPEHRSIVVTDVSRGEDPWLVLSGDSLLVGDLARPDLAVEPQAGALDLRASLAGLLELGDHVELWPAHVGGSLCGGAGLSGKTSSTIGYERLHNPLLEAGEELFVDELLHELPPRPPNLARIVQLNSSRGAAVPPPIVDLDGDRLALEIAAGAQVIDGRSPDVFDTGHLRGAINLPAGRAQGTRAAWVVDPAARLVVIGSDPAHAHKIATGLHAVGLWSTIGIAGSDPRGWLEAGLEVERTSSWDVATLAEKLHRGEARLIDVREQGEWIGGHVDGSHSLPLHRLADAGAITSTETDVPLAVACAAGMRAAFAASVIRRSGHPEVIRVSGGGIGNLSNHEIALVAGE